VKRMFGHGRTLWGLLLAASAGVAGCGGQGKPVKVNGVITLDGKPLPGATVTFLPAAEGGRSASGLTEANGSFNLTTFKPGDGALPGEYKITVQVLEGDKSNQSQDPTQMDDKARAAFFARMNPAGRAKEEMRRRKAPKVVPEVYSDLKRTPLKCTVPVDGKVEMDLKSTAR
jgi:hypothetical protein